jgi:5-methylcytosine-specific restriction endonuclease McrA
MAEHPVCERCQAAASSQVHHARKLANHPEDLIDPAHCEALCQACHSAATARGE